LHNAFIDYTQALDWVYREKIIKCLNNYELSSKLIKLIAKTLQDRKARFKVRIFLVSTGVKQGDTLSTTIFSIDIDDTMKQLELRGNISTRLKQCSAHVDGILITARTKQTIYL
jgi:hypothetical protein